MEDRVLSPGAKLPRFRVYYLFPWYFSLAFPLIVSFKIQARDDFTFSFILFCDQTFNSYLEESIPKYKSVPARESGNKLEQLLSKRALNRIWRLGFFRIEIHDSIALLSLFRLKVFFLFRLSELRKLEFWQVIFNRHPSSERSPRLERKSSGESEKEASPTFPIQSDNNSGGQKKAE